MVNRPGRSKGCITCRRRKVKCDERRPLCERCAKSGNNCEGYQDSRTFVWVDPKGTDPQQTSGAPEASSSSSKTSTSTAPLETFSVQPTAAAQQESFFASIDPIILQGFMAPFLPVELDHQAFREAIYQTHLFQHVLGHTETGRNSALSLSINSTDLNRDSFNALSMTFFGRLQSRPEVAHQGELLYSKAILQLAGSLNGDCEAMSTSVLMATLTLAVHEIVNRTGCNGWVQHAGGLERLIEARGLFRHQTPQERLMFECCRPMIIAKALSEQKRTFLEQLEWRTMPWPSETFTKTQQSQLFDILTFVPGLLEDLANLRAATATLQTIDPSLDANAAAILINKQKQRLQTRIDEHLYSVNEWYQNWSTLYPDAVQTISNPLQFGVFNPPYPLHLFGMPFLFPSLLRANEYILYNTITFLLLTIASQLASSVLSSPSQQKQISKAQETSTRDVRNITQHRRNAATEICKAIPYLLQFDLHAYSGAYLLCFPLNILLGIKGTRTEEGQWVAHVLTDIAVSWGILAGNAWSSRLDENAAGGEDALQEAIGEGW